VIRRFLRHNWFLKLFSVLLASLLWLTISADDNYQIDQTIRINFQGMPWNMETTGQTATQIDLRLRGSRNLLNNMSPADVTAVISLSGQTPGQKNIALSNDNFQTPGGVEVLRFEPSRVEFNLERTITRTLPVRARLEGTQAEGFILGRTTVTPPTVQVSGPESVVGSRQALLTTPISIDGARGDVHQSVDLATVDPLVRLASLSQYAVSVEVHEISLEASYLIGMDPQLEASPWVVRPGQIMVQISGPESRMTSFDPEGLSFTVNVSVLEPGTHTLSPNVLGLDDAFFNITSIVPPQIEVRSAEQ
jgi:YbbR domain-containing protein